MVVYCKSVHFHGFEDAKTNLSFYEMSSFKEGKAKELAEESGEENLGLRSTRIHNFILFFKRTVQHFGCNPFSF